MENCANYRRTAPYQRKPTKPKDIEKYGKEFPVWKQEEPINKWKKAKRGFYWGIHFYRLTETDSHS